MILPGHIAGGYLSTYAIIALSTSAINLTPTQITLLYIVGILASEAPDLDIIKFYFEEKRFRNSVINVPETLNNRQNEIPNHSHRDHITHTPLFWFCVSLLISVIGFSLHSDFIYLSGLVILAGSWTHLILDSIEYGIRWLWPFYNKKFCLKSLPEPTITENKGTFSYYSKYITSSYLKQWSFYVEILIVVIAVAVFIAKLEA